LAYLVVDSTSSKIENFEKYIRLDPYCRNLENKDGIFKDTELSEKLKIKSCKKSEFPYELHYQYDIMSLDHAICIESSDKMLGGYFSGSYSKYLNITIVPCYNSTDYPFQCESKENILKFLDRKDVLISMNYQSLEYDAKRHEKPINSFIQEDNYIMDPFQCKLYEYFIEEFIVRTDDGIIGNDYWTSNFYEFIDIDKKFDSFFQDNWKEKEHENHCFWQFKYFTILLIHKVPKRKRITLNPLNLGLNQR
jgi:hypothetical protein